MPPGGSRSSPDPASPSRRRPRSCCPSWPTCWCTSRCAAAASSGRWWPPTRSARPWTRSCSSPWPGSRSGPPCPANSSRRPPPPPSRSRWCWLPVRYYATASGPRVREAMRTGLLGQIATPGSGHRVLPGVDWCADNAAFTGGYPVALVAQDGLEHLTVPWHSFDVLFIGGGTAWKLGPAAADLAAQARAHGRRVHCGRVNSLRRLRYAASIGCDSVDGTFLAYGPDRNLPVLLRWLSAIHTQSPAEPAAGARPRPRHPSPIGLPPLAVTAGQDDHASDPTAPIHPTSPRSSLPRNPFVVTSGDPPP